ncbi:MAG: 6-phosphofructokinase [Clostridia bacterium]|nr:6-phosphofructokinase [Clostridia bacterium]
MDILKGNVIISQSGGPTAAINATLSGVIRGCLECEDKITTIYGAKNGVEGLLREDIVDLSSFFKGNEDKLSFLESTPASALGSCRLRLPTPEKDREIYDKLFAILNKLNIKYFFYIGGNDSMDTVDKLHSFAVSNGQDIKFIGIPKTIDNDLVCTDHTPGYGSAAKYIATSMEEILRDCGVYTVKSVTVVEIMGRDAGWLTLASSLAGMHNGKEVDLIYLPEKTFSIEEFIESVKEKLKDHPDVVVAVSEGIRYASGRYVCEGTTDNKRDAFGHKFLSGTAKQLTHIVAGELGCKTRAIELNVLQRCAGHIQSACDIDESVMIGKEAVYQALSGKSGIMLIFEREDGEYKTKIAAVDVSRVANNVKFVPDEFINETGNGVTSKAREYLLPLIKGERYVEYKDGLPVHCIIK